MTERARQKIRTVLDELEAWKENPLCRGIDDVHDLYCELVWVAFDVGEGKHTTRVTNFLENEMGIYARFRKTKEKAAMEHFFQVYRFSPLDREMKRMWIDAHLTYDDSISREVQRRQFVEQFFEDPNPIMSPFWTPEFVHDCIFLN